MYPSKHKAMSYARMADRGKRLGERTGKATGYEPKPEDRISFTDTESRTMKDPAAKWFIQGYNAQCAVDDTARVIIAASVTTQANDKRQIKPMITAIGENLGCLPKEPSAGAGYFSEETPPVFMRGG